MSVDDATSYCPTPMCRLCKKSMYTEDASTHCCDCGVSLCERCSKVKCGSKLQHRTVDLKGMGPEEAVSLYSFCSKCKKNGGNCVMARRHCNDCGKSYCDMCSEAHEQDRKTKWHVLIHIEQLFVNVRTSRRRLPSAPPEVQVEGTKDVPPALAAPHEHGFRSERMVIGEIILNYNAQCLRIFPGGYMAHLPATVPVAVPTRTRTSSSVSCCSELSSSLDSITFCDESPPPYTKEDPSDWHQFNHEPSCRST